MTGYDDNGAPRLRPTWRNEEDNERAWQRREWIASGMVGPEVFADGWTHWGGTAMDPRLAMLAAGKDPDEGRPEGKPRYRGRALDFPQPYRMVWVRYTEPEPGRYGEIVLTRWETEFGYVLRTPTRKIYHGICQAPWCAEPFTLTRSSRAKERRWNLYCCQECADEVRRVKARERMANKRAGGYRK